MTETEAISESENKGLHQKSFREKKKGEVCNYILMSKKLKETMESSSGHRALEIMFTHSIEVLTTSRNCVKSRHVAWASFWDGHAVKLSCFLSF